MNFKQIELLLDTVTRYQYGIASSLVNGGKKDNKARNFVVYVTAWMPSAPVCNTIEGLHTFIFLSDKALSK